MNDAGALHAADAGQAFAAMADQRIDQRPRRVSRRRMHDEPGRLVDDEEMGVLEDHVERDVLAGRRRVDRGRNVKGDDLPGAHRKIGVGDARAIDRDGARLDQRL